MCSGTEQGCHVWLLRTERHRRVVPWREKMQSESDCIEQDASNYELRLH